jgi:hypothetical protein
MNSEQYKAIEAAISGGCGTIGGLAGASLCGIPGSIAGATIGTSLGQRLSQQVFQEIASFHVAKILHQKMLSDFKNSFLLDWDIFDHEIDELENRRIKAHHRNWKIDKDIDLGNYLYFNRIEPWNFQVLSDLNEIRKIEILAGIGRSLRISVSSVNAGVMATLISLNQKFKSHCNFDLINIDHSSVNGIEQIQAVNKRVKEYDFLISPCDSFLLSRGNGISIYSSLGPINWHAQHVFSKKRKRVNLVGNDFLTFRGSSVEMQHLLNIGIPEKAELVYLDEEVNFSKILEKMHEGDHISLWEPLASRMRADKKFEEINTEYKVVFHLFAKDCWHSPDYERKRLAFQDLFQNEWRICKYNQKRSLYLLKSDCEYIRTFAIGSGL